MDETKDEICTACNGTGLKDNQTLCPTCGGTPSAKLRAELAKVKDEVEEVEDEVKTAVTGKKAPSTAPSNPVPVAKPAPEEETPEPEAKPTATEEVPAPAGGTIE